MKQYLDLMLDVLDNGDDKDDRTGIGTISSFGHQLKFDLREGFPAVTTKKLAWKSVVSELLWFLKGSTDLYELRAILHGEENRYNDEKKTIWDGNAQDANNTIKDRFSGYNLGNMYGMSWRKLPCTPHGMIRLKRKTYDDSYVETHICPNMDIIYNEPILGVSKKNLSYKVIGESDGNYVIQFVNTGYYKLTKKVHPNIKDMFEPSVCGVGYIGDYKVSTEFDKKIYRIWQDMLIRVYKPRSNHRSYSNVFVCKRWLSFSNFHNDCFNLWGFQEFADSGFEYQIDKDYYGSNIYSPETCIFIPANLNKMLNGGGEEFKIYEYKGNYFHSRKSLQSYRGLSRKATLPKDVIIHKSDDEYVVRPIIYIDQISTILNEAKSNPNSRRLVVDSWNTRTVGNSVLAICHPMFQVGVTNGHIDIMWFQRSNDFFLGSAFNIASYALLLHIFARILGYKPRYLTGSLGDVHIYKNHIDQCNEQLKRDPLPLPTIWINPELKTLKDFENAKVDDFKLIDYQHHPAIKADMAV